MRLFALVALIIVAVLIVVAVSLPFLINANRFKPKLESALAAALGRPVTIGNLEFSILSGGVQARDLTVAEDPAFGKTPFLEAKSLDARVELWPLIVSRELHVKGLTLEEPEVRLIQASSGRWNYSSLGRKPEAQRPEQNGAPAPARPAAQAPGEPGKEGGDLSARFVRIADGRISIRGAGTQKPLRFEEVNLRVRDFTPGASFPFSLTAKVAGGGEIKAGGTAGPVPMDEVVATPLSATVDVARLNLAALGGVAPDVSGVASFQGTARSSGGVLTLSGKARAQDLKVAKNGAAAREPVEFDFVLSHDLRRHAGALKRGNIRSGGVVASLTGNFTQKGDATVLDLDLTGRDMPVPDLAGLLPALGVMLPSGSRLEGGVATALFSITGPAGRAVTKGSLVVNNTRLVNFDLGGKLQLAQALAGVPSSPDTEIKLFSANLQMGPAGTVVRDLRLIVPSIGELKGGGTIGPTKALDFKMSATVQTPRTDGLSKTPIPFTVSGTTAAPVFKPDMQALAAAESQALLQSETQKKLPGETGETVSKALEELFGGQKKEGKKK